MTRALAALFTISLMACADGEQSFSTADDDANTADGNGLLRLNPPELLFENLDWDGSLGGTDGPVSASLVFEAINDGDANLKLYNVDIADSGGGVFYMEDVVNKELAPGASREVVVVATLSTFEAAEGTIRLKTNDTNALDYRMPLTALPYGWEGDDDTGE